MPYIVYAMLDGQMIGETENLIGESYASILSFLFFTNGVTTFFEISVLVTYPHIQLNGNYWITSGRHVQRPSKILKR
jgi:hypothetical protein